MIGRPKKEKKPLCVLSLRKEKIIEIIGSRWYMPGTSQEGGTHTLWGPPLCEVPGIYHLENAGPIYCGVHLFVRYSAYMPSTGYTKLDHKESMI